MRAGLISCGVEPNPLPGLSENPCPALAQTSVANFVTPASPSEHTAHALLNQLFSMAAVDRKHSLEGDEQMLVDVIPLRKRLKPSDLPISQTKRSIIDSLLHTFKKKGEFDALRKLLYAQCDSDVCTTIST